MKTVKLATAVVVLGSLLTGTAVAQMFPGYPASIPGQPAGSPYAGYQYGAYQEGGYAYAAPQPPDVSPSPSDVPVPEPTGEAAATDAGCNACDTCNAGGLCGGRRNRSCDPCQPWTLPQPWCLQQRGIRIGGWIEQGISVVANNPADRYNGPVTFNDRDGEYQMNQFWLFMERAVDTGGCGWDLGGRIDFVYGTDARFTQAADGLEADWNQTSRFYQAALPQFYLDVGYNDWTLRIGHFLTILGYEVELAPENFFYSHAYVRQYGEPVTHTGMLLTRRFGDRLSVSAGVHRGNDQFNDTDGRDSLDFLGGATWTSWNERLSLAFGISATEDGPGVTTQVYSLVGSLQVTDNLTYVIQHDLGQTTGAPNRNRTVEWYGVNQYLLYDINTCWAAGLRFEWFRDDDGTRVTGLGDGNQNTGPFVGNFYEISAGLNWKPHANLTVRPEVRWDWFDGGAPLGARPYDAGDRNNQFLFGCDLICTF